jgi:Tol biopolymer transport system component
MIPAVGDRLAQYHLVRKLGEGGMGVVFEAHDSRLGRSVAIKLLPEGLARDPERLGRFEREAKVLASLNDPGIAAIYGLEAAEGTQFLVLELVPGETIAARLARGSIPATDALGLCGQVAAALEAAHERGVVHRDLKPANVAVTPEGRVKLLDFGLAKALEIDGMTTDRSQSPTVTSAGTAANVILGTAAYMSPEQARGRAVDRRSDIWSFGCLLYEMLAGRQAFGGETVTDCLARILEREPDWSALPAATPEWVVDLLERCLRKDQRSRLRDIGDARIAIDEGLSGERAQPAGPRAPARLGTALLVVGVGVAAAVAGMAIGRFGPGPGTGRPGAGSAGGAHGSGGPEIVGAARLTHDPGISEWPTWSPDGTTLAFVSNREGNFDIFVRRIEGGHEVNVTSDPGQDFQPAYSPDGSQIAFISTRSSRTGMIQQGTTFGLEFRTYGGDLWAVPALGGQSRRLARDANFPAWSPDGRRIIYVSGREGHRVLLEIGADGGEPRTVLASADSTYEIVRVRYSSGGSWVSFETTLGGLHLVPTAGGTPRHVATATSHAWDASGHRLYFLARHLEGGTRVMTVNVDETKGALIGEPRTLSWMTGILRNLDVSKDGRRLVVSELEGSMNLTLLPLGPGDGSRSGPEEILSAGQVIDRSPAFSPDGRRIAFTSDRLGAMDIWIFDLATRRQSRLALPGNDMGVNQPVWSPDGKNIALVRLKEAAGGDQSLWLAAVDGSQAEELLTVAQDLEVSEFSADGRSLYYTRRVDGVVQIFVHDFGTRQSRQITTSPGDKAEPRVSPDGRFLAFISNAGGSLQVRRMPLGGGPEEQLTTGDERMRHMQYSRDGRYIYVQRSHRNVLRFPANGGPLEPITTFPESGLFIEEPTLSPDGRSLAYCRRNGGASLWMLTVRP